MVKELQNTSLTSDWLKNDFLIGVIGLGAVGSSLSYVLNYYYKNRVVGYDIKGQYEWEPILSTNIAFICVPTPEKDGRLDCSAVMDVLKRLESGKYKGIVAIKSTLRIGFMQEASLIFPDLHLIYCPEFLREKSCLQWSVCPDRIVISGDKEDAMIIKKILHFAEEAEIIFTDHLSAEIGKLAHNAFIACKVSFTNEIERISISLGANPNDVMGIIHADRRVKSKDHLRPGLGPYGGKCIPKDTKELMNAAGGSVLFDAIEKVNEETCLRYKKTKDTNTK